MLLRRNHGCTEDLGNLGLKKLFVALHKSVDIADNCDNADECDILYHSAETMSIREILGTCDSRTYLLHFATLLTLQEDCDFCRKAAMSEPRRCFVAFRRFIDFAWLA
jgi:hypothetical protein